MVSASGPSLRPTSRPTLGQSVRLTFHQTWLLVVLVARYWARAGLPGRRNKDHGRRASGALLRFTVLLLMTHWGYRIGVALAVLPARERAVTWLLVGLFGLAFTWGAMGRTAVMRAPQVPTAAPLLDTLPLAEASRVTIGLLERLPLYALTVAAVVAVTRPAVDVVVLGLLLPTAGLLVGEASLRLLRTAVSPLRMVRISQGAIALQFPAFSTVAGAGFLAGFPRVSRLVAFARPAARALLEGEGRWVAIASLVGLITLAGLAIRAAERIGYDRVDVVPPRKLPPARSEDLDLARVERVLARREPGGVWLPRFVFLYTAAACALLVAFARAHPRFPQETLLTLLRATGLVALLAGFLVSQTRASRMVLRDAGARPMLAPLPIAPADLLRGKTRALLFQAVFVAAPYAVLFVVPNAAFRAELAWRLPVTLLAVALGASAMVAVAFLTQGVGMARGLGGNVTIETTLVAMPLMAVAGATHPWGAVLSLGALALLAFEARRSALHRVRWADDGDDFERETPVWRALLVFAAFQATMSLAERVVSLMPVADGVRVAMAYAIAAAALTALTSYGRRDLSPLRLLPDLPIPGRVVALAGGLVAGAASGVLAAGYLRILLRLGADLPSLPPDGPSRVALIVTAVLMAPIAEETFFRGWLQEAIAGELPARWRRGAPLLAAFAFAVVHAPLSFVPVVVLGLVAGVVYARTRSLVPSIVAHATHNALATAATLWLT